MMGLKHFYLLTGRHHFDFKYLNIVGSKIVHISLNISFQNLDGSHFFYFHKIRISLCPISLYTIHKKYFVSQFSSRVFFK